MWFIALFSICAAFSFRREIARRGYDSPKAVRFPIIAGIVAIFLQQLVVTGFALLLARAGVHPQIVESLTYVAGFFVIALFIGAIAKNWFAIKKLPLRARPAEPPDA